MYLYIDTTERDSFSIALLDDNKVIKKKTVKSHRKHSEKLLKSIEQMILVCKKSLKDIKGIAVVKGPGSFTSLRIGIATANALAYGFGIRVLGIGESASSTDRRGGGWDEIIKKLNRLANNQSNNVRVIVPEYGQEPHITEPKK